MSVSGEGPIPADVRFDVTVAPLSLRGCLVEGVESSATDLSAPACDCAGHV